MGVLDGPLRGAANTLLNVLGCAATLRKRSATFNPLTNAESSVTETSWTVKASPPSPYSARKIDGTVIREGDASCLLATYALDQEGITLPGGPVTNYYLDFGSDVWTVVSINHLRSGDQSAAVELQLRR